MYFLLRRGLHADDKKLYRKGDVIQTDINLSEMFGAEKFERITEDQIPEVTKEIIKEEGDVVAHSDGLDSMTVRELRRYAQDVGVDLSEVPRRRKDILDAIRSVEVE